MMPDVNSGMVLCGSDEGQAEREVSWKEGELEGQVAKGLPTQSPPSGRSRILNTRTWVGPFLAAWSATLDVGRIKSNV